MKAAVFHSAFDVRMEERADPVIVEPTDAVVRVIATCVCGSDLWYYRGLSPRQAGQAIGHEFIGVVELVGDAVTGLAPGTFVVAPFMWSDGTCSRCRNGVTSACRHGGIWGAPEMDGGQGEALRVPHADSTLVPLGRERPSDRLLPALLALADVMTTGHHAAVSAGVQAGDAVVVVGDGAVGLCAVAAAARLGAERVVLLTRHEARAEIGVRLGATEVIASGDEGALAALAASEPDAVLECVGTGESMRTALRLVRPGGGIGYVGVPHGVELPVQDLFARNVRVAGGLAPARAYLPELLQDVLHGRLDPSPVFDSRLEFGDIPTGYALMHERSSTKVWASVP